MLLAFIPLPAKPAPPLGTGITAVAILGDSIVGGMTPYQSGLTPPINGAANLGVGGQTSVQIAARASSALGYSHVLIEGGINDFILDYPNPPGNSIVNAYAQMLQLLSPTVQVRVIGISHVDPGALGSGYTFLNNAAIDAVNNQLINLCATFANCLPVIPAMRQDVTGLTVDGIHKSAAGYAAWAPLLAAGL